MSIGNFNLNSFYYFDNLIITVFFSVDCLYYVLLKPYTIRFIMSDLSDDIGLDESYRLSPKDVINDQSDSIYNDSINRSSDSFNTDFSISDETMRLLFLAIASITVLICLTICISVCICICLNRYVKKMMCL